ncbi:alpha-ribazole phosphatase [Trichlorobacter ammonificans]|uniref:Alpha-ribazole phosphatase n=1 Tax=Trichlorobacter ammonificans TaxID=2916410 RepID=A0ABM9D9M9_9BACT|nr:alpha-ribazole phosphatase [Trichlorobacter ammonificans]CAH2031936.1 Alpha-ribazole-5'-phosphate phosphatase [Trichlorobacter ammonificans]
MTPSTRIYLIRHGQVEGHEERRYNGQTDVALTDLGVEQYHQLKDRLSDSRISACYSSDLTRCRTGAEIICGQFAIQPVFRPELRELNIGIWEGLTWQEIQSRWPEEWQARLNDLVNYRVTQGENLLDVDARVMPVVREVVERHRGQEILLVGHGGVNRVILLHAIGAPLVNMFNIEQNYGCLNIIDYYPDGRATVKLLNG